MAFKSSDSQNSVGRNRGGKEQKKKMKKMRSMKIPKLSSLNSSSRRATWQFDLSAIDLAMDELNSIESSDLNKENFEVEAESEDTLGSSSSNRKSRLDHNPDISSPHDPKYSKSAESLSGKIAMQNFTRTPSMRSVRILKSKASFRSRRPLIKKQSEATKDSHVERATCSSTLKDSNFPKEIELHESENEVDRISVMKVCPYHHCSLNGHCHGPELVEKKPFLRRKKYSMKTPKSKKQENKDKDVGEIRFGRKSRSEKFIQEDDLTTQIKLRDMSYTGERQENGDVGQIVFGGKSQAINIVQENEGGDAGEIVFSGKSQLENGSQENEGGEAGETLFGIKSLPEKVSEESEVGDAGEILFGGKSGGEKFFEENLTQARKFPEPRLKKENSISMWHLIHRQMVSSLKDEVQDNEGGTTPSKFSPSKKSLSRNISDAEMGTEETEVRKNFAVKLVREAIEKILLPEVQDQSEQENLEGSISNSTHLSKQVKERGIENEDDKEEKMGEKEKKAPKSWSYLKKVILLKRFVKELQKVREFGPRKSESRPLDHDQEAEKVNLRPQMTSEKKNSEEWMLDYAIRQVVSELAPNQKKKVALLVKAFETVAPPQQDEVTKTNVHNVKGNNQDFESNEVDNVVSTSDDSSSQINEPHERKSRVLEVEGIKEEHGVLSSSLNCNLFEKSISNIEEQKGDSCDENGAKSSSSKDQILEVTNGEIEETNGDSEQECESTNESTRTNDSEAINKEDAASRLLSNSKVCDEINDNMEEKQDVYMEESVSNSGSTPINDSLRLQAKRENRVSLWHLIHKQMVSGLETESRTESLQGEAEEKQADDVSTACVNNGIESEDTKMRKIFAIKLVREAIEKILLPEVQDLSSDDQSTTSDVTSDQDFNEKNCNEDFEKPEVNIEDDRSDESKVETQKDNDKSKAERNEGSKSEKQKPKSWSYLKKVILLKRFVKELEKVKKFNPRKPNFLPLQHDQEAEKVNLRPQIVGEKRNTDEWMLDYAIRQVVSQLAPTQKQKVALLVKAFETVAPPNGDYSKIRESGSKMSDKFSGMSNIRDIESNACEDIVSSNSCEPKEQPNEELEVNSKGFVPESAGLEKGKMVVEKQNNIKMWHMVYQHVVTGIVEKVGAELLLDERVENVRNCEAGNEDFHKKSQERLEFSKSDAVKLVQEAVDEILDDSSETQSTSSGSVTQDDCQSPTSDIIISQEEEKDRIIVRNEKQKSKNWSKLKKLILLKRSIKALENVRKRDPQPPKILAVMGDVAKEKVDLKSQMVEERKKAEQWMLDYAVQHIVTKLTPARKRRVAMLVEAFEAVVPLPET